MFSKINPLKASHSSMGMIMLEESVFEISSDEIANSPSYSFIGINP